ncbi:MAG: hypothetical protein C0623_11090 [Desulfuromonas sp.]|nr:MAG: hypothetical protein C0623_11090 [Desulfuromonas sp.]
MDSSKKITSINIMVAAVFFLCLFAPEMTLAGTNPVVAVSDSSAGGAINYEPLVTSTEAGADIASGGSSSVEISPGVLVTASTMETAVNSGSFGMDQISDGFGSGGVVVTLSEQTAENVRMAAENPSLLVNEAARTPLDVLQSLSTALNLSGLVVTMPNGKEVTLTSIVENTTAALSSGDPTLIGTAINDAAIAFSQVVKSGADLADIRNVADAIAALLDAARGSLS